VLDELRILYGSERCQLCADLGQDGFGLCEHREIDVAFARLEGLKLRALLVAIRESPAGFRRR
jgi:hypothetical protein